MRLDKFLKLSRIIKRRTLSKEISEASRVKVNGKVAKPATKVKIGDEIEVSFGRTILTVKVLMLKDHVLKDESSSLYEIIKEEKVEEVTIDDFAKLQFKVGTIVKCEPHPKADRLLVEQVDLGGEVRQIVSGIAKHYKPEELIGKQVVVVTNLKPVKLRGVESYGMILCATDDKDLSFVTVAKEMPNGVTVR